MNVMYRRYRSPCRIGVLRQGDNLAGGDPRGVEEKVTRVPGVGQWRSWGEADAIEANRTARSSNRRPTLPARVTGGLRVFVSDA